jgi:hypothetical protein
MRERRAGIVDLLEPCMDNGWCFGYTCQKRLSSFWATVSTGATYAVNATGTPARLFRVWQPYAPEGSEVVLHVNYFEPLRRYVWAPGAGRIDAGAARPQIGDASGHGAYFWDQVRGAQMSPCACLQCPGMRMATFVSAMDPASMDKALCDGTSHSVMVPKGACVRQPL